MCVCVCACVCMCACALTIVSMDKSLHFINSLIIIVIFSEFAYVMFQFLNTQYEMRIATMEMAKSTKEEAGSEHKKKHTELESR